MHTAHHEHPDGSIGIAHVTVTTDEMRHAGYVQNAPNRCYFCKTELYARLSAYAREHAYDVVLDGLNTDDLSVHRPGREAADEHAIVSPLVEAGLAKPEVRRLAAELGLSNAERPSSPCLSSRIAYGTPVTVERLSQIGKSEAALRAMGFDDVRVRLHDKLARIEVPKHRLLEAVAQAEAMTQAVRDAGFVYVTLDLAGLRSGSLLEAVK